MTAIRENGAASGAGALATFGYDNQGRRTSLTRGNGTATSYSYDPASRLSQLVQNLAGTAQDLSLGLAYNPASQIASATRSNDAYAWTAHYNVNRPYTANGLNQYTASGPVVPTYDARGNLTAAGSVAYAYTAENRLKSASTVGTLAYDPLGRLQETALGATTRFNYDGMAMIAEHNSSNQLTRRYVHGPGVDEPLVWYEGAGTTDRRWLHADERGSVIAVTNGSGAATIINSYDEYGIPGAANAGRFQYTGQAWLPELGLYHYKARAYSHTLGRFLQTDPIGYGDGMNMYAYVGNDPVNATDPSGLKGTEAIAHPRIVLDGPDITVTAFLDSLLARLDRLSTLTIAEMNPTNTTEAVLGGPRSAQKAPAKRKNDGPAYCAAPIHKAGTVLENAGKAAQFAGFSLVLGGGTIAAAPGMKPFGASVAVLGGDVYIRGTLAVVAGSAAQAFAGDPAARFNLTNNIASLALGPLANLSKIGDAITGFATDAALATTTYRIGKSKC